MIYILLSLILAYLIGSIPTAYIFAKVLKGIDIREHGSGNVGATNVARTIGKIPGIIVLVLDFLKGALPVIIIPNYILHFFYPGFEKLGDGLVYILLGTSSISGHIWSCFLKFKGGKGVATTAGVILALEPLILLGGLVVWVIIFSICRYVSLASITAACTLPIFAIITGKSLSFICFCALLCIVGLYTHRSNIKRLFSGTENRIKF